LLTWRELWTLCHRVDLHNTLKAAAENAGIEIFLQSRVSQVDIRKSEITLVDGRKVTGDLILGADGTHVSISHYFPPGKKLRID